MSNDDCVYGNSQHLFPSHHSNLHAATTESVRTGQPAVEYPGRICGAHSAHSPSPLPPLGRLLTTAVFATQAKLFFLSSSPSPKHL